jgi:hypothetical protein
VQIDAATGTAGERIDLERQQAATSCTPEHFVRPHEPRSSRSGGVLDRPARRTGGGRGWLLTSGLPVAVPRFVLIPALSVFAIAHAVHRAAIIRPDQANLEEVATDPTTQLPRLYEMAVHELSGKLQLRNGDNNLL